MKRGWWGLALLCVIGCGPTWPPTPEGLYMARCSRCHHADGSSATASEQADKEIDLRDAFFQSNVSDEDLARIIVYGKGRMMGIPNLEAAEVDSIVLHVRRLARGGVSTLDSSATGP